MENMSTEQVILGLLRLEVRYGRISKITKDAGSNMMGNLNPRTKDGERLFNIVTDITHHVDSQFRNYVERSVSTLKKFIRQACGLTRQESFPTLIRSEAELLFERAARLCNNIPYAKGIENLFIRPADFMNPDGVFEDLPRTTSHLEGINYMLERIRKHQTRLAELRDECLKNDWERYKLGEKSTGAIKKNVSPTVGDLIMFKNDHKHNKTEYGRIKRLVSAQTLEIQTRRGLILRPTSLTTPLSPACLLTGDRSAEDINVNHE